MKKRLKTTDTIIILLFLLSVKVLAQGHWQIGGNNSTTTSPAIDRITANNKLGTTEPGVQLNIWAGNKPRATFSTGSALGTGAHAGDGLRIIDPTTNGTGHLDLWTGPSGSSETHAKFDGSGNIDGQDGWFEMTGNNNGLQLNARGTGVLSFNTSFNGNFFERMRITSNGFIGVGRNFTPTSLMHLNDGINGVYTQFTNDATTVGGFKIGVSANGTAEIRQQEGKPLNFLTANTQRATIDANGNVGIGNATPSATLDVVRANATQFSISDHIADYTQPSSTFSTASFRIIQTTGDLVIFPYKGTATPPTANSSLTNTGIGGFSATFPPQSFLHLNSDLFTQMQFTNGNYTNPGATDGFKVGIGIPTIGTVPGSGTVALIRQQENDDIIFYTGNNNSSSGTVLHAERMRIVGKVVNQGFVGIGTSTPSSILHVDATSYNIGEVFRTTSNATTGVNAWRMVTKVGTDPVSEKFTVYNNPNYAGNPNNVILQATQVGAVMEFKIGGNFLRSA